MFGENEKPVTKSFGGRKQIRVTSGCPQDRMTESAMIGFPFGDQTR